MCGAFLLKLLQLIFYYILLLTDHVSISDNNIPPCIFPEKLA